MGGKRLDSFRAGDRSEYLALFALSRIAFVVPTPRQEDFGVHDFFCVLTRKEGRNVFPENGFYVQVKSNTAPVKLSKDDVKWISDHMEHPLFICVVDKNKSRISIYSSMYAWNPIFLMGDSLNITLNFDDPKPTLFAFVKKAPKNVNVNVGKPIFSSSLDDVEKFPERMYRVIKAWIESDKRNIAQRNAGRLYCSVVTDKVNDLPSIHYTSFFHGSNFGATEDAIKNTLVALLYNYDINGDEKKGRPLFKYLESIYGTLGSLEKKIVDNVGKRFRTE